MTIKKHAARAAVRATVAWVPPRDRSDRSAVASESCVLHVCKRSRRPFALGDGPNPSLTKPWGFAARAVIEVLV